MHTVIIDCYIIVTMTYWKIIEVNKMFQII